MKPTFKEFLTEKEKVVTKNILSYSDGNKNVYKIHIGENNGKFFVTLKGAHADHSLSKPMFNHQIGTAASVKLLRDAIKSTWDKIKDEDAGKRSSALKAILDKTSDVKWSIEK